MNRKRFSWMALTGLTLSLITSAGAQTSVPLWFHAGAGPERLALESIIKQFNATNKDIQIKPVQLPEGTYNDQVNAAALANQLPCLLDFDGPNLYNYAWSGKLTPIDKYVSASTKRDFLPSIIRQGTYDGKLYSLGQFDSGLALWVNKKLLAKAGIPVPTQPWTGAQFTNVLAKLKASGLQYPLDMKFNYGRSEWFTFGFSPFLQSFGADLINRNGYKTADGTLNGPAAVKAMTYFQTLVKNYVNTGSRSDTEFVEGKAAISYVGHWVYPDYSKALGSDLVLVPMPNFGGKVVTGSGSWNWGLTKNCAVPDAAGKVLNYLLSSKSVLAMTNANGAVPSRQSVAPQSKLYSATGPLRVYLKQINAGRAVVRPVTPAYPTITRAFAQAVDNIAKGSNVKSELDKAVSTIDQDIEDNNGYPVK